MIENILGTDGRVHIGDVTRRVSGTIMEMHCDATPLRPVSDAIVARLDPKRVCQACQNHQSESQDDD